MQIASVGKSLTFGHLALIEGRSRVAQVVAETELVCYAISIEALRDFGRSHPNRLCQDLDEHHPRSGHVKSRKIRSLPSCELATK